jgi:hypothetical protein
MSPTTAETFSDYQLHTMITDELDRLVELGGGTDYGVADYLHRAGIRGEPLCAMTCVIAQWLYRQLRGQRGLRFVDSDLFIQVTPNVYSYTASQLDWSWAHGPLCYHTITLPPPLRDVAVDFDRDIYPELETCGIYADPRA